MYHPIRISQDKLHRQRIIKTIRINCLCKACTIYVYARELSLSTIVFFRLEISPKMGKSNFFISNRNRLRFCVRLTETFYLNIIFAWKKVFKDIGRLVYPSCYIIIVVILQGIIHRIFSQVIPPLVLFDIHTDP